MPVEKFSPPNSLDDERIEALKHLFPEAVADGRINFGVLRDLLNTAREDEEPDAEHFGLFWPGKREARRLATQPSHGSLVPVPGEGIEEEYTENIFIEGDNLEVLKLLQKSYASRVKMIYIDPPYNTGNDFIYKDDFKEPLESYLRRTGQTDEEGGVLTSNTRADGRYHSNWLNMMYPRLRLARNLLREDGVIFVSIADHEIHNLRQIMNEVFGEENFVASLIWQKVYAPKNTARHFSEDHDYILAYAKSAGGWKPELLPRSEEANSRYENIDNDPRGPWKSSDMTARNYYSEGQYEVTSPSGKLFKPTIGTYWRVRYEKFLEMDRDNRIWWGPKGQNMPAQKRFLSEVKQGIIPQTLWKYQDVGHTQEAKKEMLEYVHFENTDNVLDSVKPTRLLQRMLQIATQPEDAIILDFFFGSATTAHAVLKQNQIDGGSRRFIGVQIHEPLPIPEAKLKTIADIGKERIRNVVAAIRSNKQENLDTGAAQLDLGFRVFKLAKSNFRRWQEYKKTDLPGLLLQMHQHGETPLIDGAKETDVLTEVALLEGFALAMRQALAEEFTRNRVWRITDRFNAHRLHICLDREIWEETIDQIAALPREDVFYCFDSALSDATKLQTAEGCRVVTV